MGSVTAYLDDPYFSNSSSVRVVKVDGSYVKKIELDIKSISGMDTGISWSGGSQHWGLGWDTPSWQSRKKDISEQLFNTNVPTQQDNADNTGKRTLWDYSDHPTLTSSVYPLSLNQNAIAGWFGSVYQRTRDGGSYKIKHQSNKGTSTSFNDSYPTAPKPTFYISMSNDSVVSLTKNYTYNYGEWFRTAESNEACAQSSITVYKKPYVADQTMTVTSSTTPNMYYPENSSQYVILKQPSVYSSIGLVDDTTTMALSGYSSMSPLWSGGSSHNFWVKILVYKPDWDSLSDIQMSWNVTGAKASQCSAQSGTITSFANIPNATGAWVNYAVGYFPFTYSMGSSLAGSNLDFNVVANGLKFSSGTQTKTVNALG